MGQFMVLQLIGLALCIIFPSIALWFPHWLFGSPRALATLVPQWLIGQGHRGDHTLLAQ